MAGTFRAACVQLRSSDDMAENIRDASALIREAAAQGAHYVQTPENTCLMAPDGGAKFELTFAEADDPALPAFRALAAELGIWLHVGSLAIKVGPGKVANRAYVIDPKGAIAASYDKIHLFDVQLANGEDSRKAPPSRRADGLPPSICPGGGWGFRSATTSAFPISTGRSPRRAAPSSPSPPPSPGRRARRTGTSSSAPGRSRPAPSSSRPPRAGVTPTAARPSATASSSARGARSWPRPEPIPASSSPTSTRPRWRRCAAASPRSPTTARSPDGRAGGPAALAAAQHRPHVRSHGNFIGARAS